MNLYSDTDSTKKSFDLSSQTLIIYKNFIIYTDKLSFIRLQWPIFSKMASCGSKKY